MCAERWITLEEERIEESLREDPRVTIERGNNRVQPLMNDGNGEIVTDVVQTGLIGEIGFEFHSLLFDPRSFKSMGESGDQQHLQRRCEVDLPFDEIDVAIGFDFHLEIISNGSNTYEGGICIENGTSASTSPGSNGMNVHTSSMHFRLASVSMRPHCRSSQRMATSRVASDHDLNGTRTSSSFDRHACKVLTAADDVSEFL